MSLRQWVTVVILITSLGASGRAMDACTEDPGIQQGRTVTMDGEVVDVACYLAHGGKGEEHLHCTQSCLSAGGAAGLLAADGSLYLLLPEPGNAKSSDEVRALAARQVKATGRYFQKGNVQAILLTRLEKR